MSDRGAVLLLKSCRQPLSFEEASEEMRRGAAARGRQEEEGAKLEGQQGEEKLKTEGKKKKHERRGAGDESERQLLYLEFLVALII